MTQLKIRFKNFNDEWVERKLGDITDRFDSNRKAVATTKRIKGDIPYYGAVGIQGYIEGYTHDGDYLLIAEDGASSMLDYPVRVTSGKIWVNNHAHVLAGLNNVADNKYLRNKLSTIDMTPYITGGSRHKLTAGDLEIIKIQLPTLPEQQKIGALFSKYDAIIALREQKLEELNALKKGLLQQMFDDGHKPQVRFSGFNDEWVEKKLGDVTEIVMGQSPHSANYTDNPQDYILVQGNADMKNGYVKPRVWTKEITKTVDENYLILGVRAPVGVVGRTEYPVVLGRGVAGIKGTNFLYQVLKRLKEIGYWNTMSTGSTFESINSKDIKNTKIQLPTLPEQQKIGQLFKQLDDRISNEQTKIEQLKAQKQGLLQRTL